MSRAGTTNSKSPTAESRERNRVHARKTRQRKKEQCQLLQSRTDELKDEQLRLKQIINEKNTASILVGLFSDCSGDLAMEDPRVEELLRRPAEKMTPHISELPPLILPGQHKKTATENAALDGIDYELLGKDRSQCSAEELDLIRRERNRMHAKRTRDRKRLFMEEMASICSSLEEENDLLREHLQSIDPDHAELKKHPKRTPTAALIAAANKTTKKELLATSSSSCNTPTDSPVLKPVASDFSGYAHKTNDTVFSTLLEAALLDQSGQKRSCPSAVSSDDSNDDDDDDDSSTLIGIAKKRRCFVEL